MADQLVECVGQMGFTHVELMPIAEHPFSGSWGYQVTGFYAPTNRYGSPQDFMYLVNAFHQNGIGVLLDWVSAHFPRDIFALAEFDGSHLYEHADPKQGIHQDWDTLIFNYGRHEVRGFLVGSALAWMDRYHIDGLQRIVRDLNGLYTQDRSLGVLDYAEEGFQWVNCDDSVYRFLRWNKNANSGYLVVDNFTPVLRLGYRVGVPVGGTWKEVINSNASSYGGDNQGNGGRVQAERIWWDRREYSMAMVLPPMTTLVLRGVNLLLFLYPANRNRR